MKKVIASLALLVLFSACHTLLTACHDAHGTEPELQHYHLDGLENVAPIGDVATEMPAYVEPVTFEAPANLPERAPFDTMAGQLHDQHATLPSSMRRLNAPLTGEYKLPPNVGAPLNMTSMVSCSAIPLARLHLVRARAQLPANPGDRHLA